MASVNEYYRAYAQLLEQLNDNNEFKRLNSAFKQADKGNDYYTLRSSFREFDLDWIEAMEKALPYIDKAIREQRRFIKQIDEVVPIEKSRKITTESVRHLAQHTNMIGRVETDTVIPKEILNIQREESFDIYENRFLRTLILRASTFIENCYRETIANNNDFYTKLSINRDIAINKQALKFDLDFELEYPGDSNEFSMNEDVSNLSEYQRVLRLRLIFSDFTSTPLMKNLVGTTEVRSPINNTNLLSKDPNFKETVKLWQFLEHYNKKGYNIIASDDISKMKTSLQKGIYNVMSLLQFVIRIQLNNSLANSLKKQYDEENIALNIKKRKEEHDKIENALKSQREEFTQKIVSYQMENSRLKSEMKETIKKQKDEYEEKLSNLDTKRIVELNEKDSFYTKKIDDLNVLHSNELHKFNEDKEIEIKKINDDNAILINSLNEEHEIKIKQIENEANSKLDSLIKDNKQAIDNLNKENDTKIKKLNEENELVLQKMSKEFEISNEKKEKEYISSLNKKEDFYKKIIDYNNNKHEIELVKVIKDKENSLKEQEKNLNVYWNNLTNKKLRRFEDKLELESLYLNQLQNNNQVLKEKIKDCKNKNKDLYSELKNKNKEIRKLQRKYTNLERQLKKLEKQKVD